MKSEEIGLVLFSTRECFYVCRKHAKMVIHLRTFAHGLTCWLTSDRQTRIPMCEEALRRDHVSYRKEDAERPSSSLSPLR